MNDEFSPFPEAPALVIGAAGIDIVGSLMLDELQSGTSNPSHIRSSFGGVARNVAENLARLGQDVILLSAVGADYAGEQLIQRAAEAGVETQNILRVPNLPTGSYLAVLNSSGELQFALDDMRVIGAISSNYLREHTSLFKQASLLFLDANLSKEALRTAISLAQRAGIPICADPTSAILANKLRPHLARLRLITPNHHEAGILCDRQIDASRRRHVVEAAKCLVNQGVGMAIITLAKYGVCYATSETNGHVPAFRTKVVDPTGGGDALTATVLFALLNGIPLDEAIRLGVSAATLTLGYSGAVIPDLSLDKLYSRLVI